MTSYSREKFGQVWADDNDAPGGHNGRDYIARRDLSDVAPTTGCEITSGTLHDTEKRQCAPSRPPCHDDPDRHILQSHL
ncbi:hypothetical protein AB0L57_19810 [Nocardia sp. NPDC052254]|uniref:hypothetical protein n=1 Tax=Nocardia sp. NPDC052254 TaxID=3155681 RepID=UPI00342CA4EF